MVKLDEFAELILAGDIDGGIQLLDEFREKVLSEHRRRVADEDNYYAWFLQDLVATASEGNEKSQTAILALVEEKSFLNETDWGGFSLTSLLSHGGQFCLLKKAVEAGANVNLGKFPALSGAVYPVELPENWLSICEFLVLKGAKVNGTGSGEPPLFHAVARNKIGAVEFLVENGADLNKVHDFYGDGEKLGTSLHYAIMKVAQGYAKASTIKRLVELGADPIIPNHDWQGAYHFLKSEVERFEKDETGEIKETMTFLSSCEEWKELPPFVCPTCAEKIKYEAKSCRFCGQVLNKAVKKGFPEFYGHSMHDLSLEWLKYDYVNHVLPEYGGSLTAPSLMGNLLNYSDLEEYDEYKKVRDVMRAREAELAGGDIDTSPNFPDATPNYWLEAKTEQRALYLTRRYVEIAQQYTKRFSGRDLRQDPENIQWAIAEFEKLIELAEKTDPPLEEYTSHFREEIERCSEQLNMLQQGRSLSEGNCSAVDNVSEALSRLEGASRPKTPSASEKKPNIVMWVIVAVVALAVLGALF